MDLIMIYIIFGICISMFALSLFIIFLILLKGVRDEIRDLNNFNYSKEWGRIKDDDEDYTYVVKGLIHERIHKKQLPDLSNYEGSRIQWFFK